MTATGLLTDRHARECIAAGYLGPWLAYFTDGSVHPAEPAAGNITIGDEDIAVNGWLVGLDLYMRDSATPETIEALERDGGLLGFAPPSGFLLPVAAASREHGCRVVLAHQEIGETKIRTATWHAAAVAWVLDGHGLCGPETALGWKPIVEVRQ